MKNNPTYTKKHWIIMIFVSLMMGSALGLVTNGNGVFYLPMARSLDASLGSISLHTTFMSFATAFASLTIPTLVDRLGIKKVIALGVSLATFGTWFLSISRSLPIIYLLGIIRGFGFAYYGLVPMSMILNRWFDKHNGLVIGLASGASGIFGSISAPLLTIAIENLGWRNAFMVKSIFVLLLVLPILLYPFKLDPKNEGLLPYGFDENKSRTLIRKTEIKDVEPTNFVFIALLVVGFLSTLIVFINSHFPGYGESVGLTPEVASFMLSGVMVGNVIWKAIFGVLSDRIGTVKSTLLMFALTFVSLIILIFFRQPIPLIIGSFFFGSVFAASAVGLPLLSNVFFGPVAGGKVYSRVSFVASFGGALGVGLTGFIFDFTGSYIPAFVVALVFIVISILLLMLAQRKYEAQLEG